MPSYQHGTVWSHEWSPSNPDGSIDTQFVLSQFASQGYIVISAVYFGVTPGSELPNSCCVNKSTVQACSDLLTVSGQFLKQKNITPGKLFLDGWSQGGFSTNLFLEHLQEQNVPVEAVVTASGPLDPFLYVSKLPS
jgi:dipeptidyl aminopeptidase/acylaminoacyl peptidase